MRSSGVDAREQRDARFGVRKQKEHHRLCGNIGGKGSGDTSGGKGERGKVREAQGHHDNRRHEDEEKEVRERVPLVPSHRNPRYQ